MVKCIKENKKIKKTPKNKKQKPKTKKKHQKDKKTKKNPPKKQTQKTKTIPPPPFKDDLFHNETKILPPKIKKKNLCSNNIIYT